MNAVPQATNLAVARGCGSARFAASTGHGSKCHGVDGVVAMNVQLNHTIVWCRDQAKSTEFLTRILGLPPAKRFMHFLVIELSNDVSIDYFETTDPIALQHLAFRVSEQDFDVVLGRLREHVPRIWADPARTQPGEINHFGGGRGVYFQDPNGHLFEVLTRSYGAVA
jgi:catechol 2,3-dioxygenase-like lactoylglutathione lyase family enzyme